MTAQSNHRQSRSSLARAEVVDGALAPALTQWDLKILRAVPRNVSLRDLLAEPGVYGKSVWRVAEAAREMDLAAVETTLNGLRQRHLVDRLGMQTQRKVYRWIRTEDGDVHAF